MPCESCGVQFSVFRRKRSCGECGRLYCGACLRRGGGLCSPCRALTTRPLARPNIAHLKPRDLQCFLQRQNVSTRGCVEKEELVSLCISHVNSAGYRRRGAGGTAGAGRGAGGAFTALRGLTTNINDLISSAFDLRPPNQHNASNCYNAAHAHAAARDPPPRERFTTRPGGEPDLYVPPPAASTPSTPPDPPRDTDDCFEVEDLEEGWELLAASAEPLPNDSEILMTSTEPPQTSQEEAAQPPPPTPPPDLSPRRPLRRPLDPPLAPRTPQRAASQLELRASPTDTADTTSLKDEPLMDHQPTETRQHITLESLENEEALEALSVKQLKELLARNRVEFRGCLERQDLLARARGLYRDHHKYREDIDKLPLEECCKICMAAPLECVLLECGHMAACTRCAKQLAECPICRQYVIRAVRVFRS